MIEIAIPEPVKRSLILKQGDERVNALLRYLDGQINELAQYTQKTCEVSYYSDGVEQSLTALLLEVSSLGIHVQDTKINTELNLPYINDGTVLHTVFYDGKRIFYNPVHVLDTCGSCEENWSNTLDSAIGEKKSK